MAADDIVLTSVTDGSTAYSVPGRRLVEIEASGPGSVTTGGFAATAGHGLVGDLLDRAGAEWMTDRFGTTTITTVVRIATDTSELFLRSMIDTPETAQVALSPLRALARGRASGAVGAVPVPTIEALGPASRATPGDDADDLVSLLERLAKLRDSGALSESEYLVAKSKLLS
jgi:putative oligomerization/nucleic acid binding protein